jgi:hypothetical protein
MSLNIEVESIDSIDESMRGLYKEQNGRFVLDVDLGDKYIPAEKVAGLKKNHDQLLSEKKAAKEEAARIAEEKARQSGDLEAIQKAFKQREEELTEKYSSLQKTVQQKELNSAAQNIAQDVADGANAKLLARLIKDRLRYDEGEIKVLDDNGNLTLSSIDDLKQEIKTSDDYKSLVRGSKATGSGATGGNNGGASGDTITRDDFEQMNQVQRAKFLKTGGKIA